MSNHPSDAPTTTETDEHTAGNGYRYAAVVQLTDDDPENGNEAGTIMVQPGPCADNTAYTAYDPRVGDFVDIGCDVLHIFEADHEMSRRNIKTWAARQANTADIDWETTDPIDPVAAIGETEAEGEGGADA